MFGVAWSHLPCPAASDRVPGLELTARLPRCRQWGCWRRQWGRWWGGRSWRRQWGRSAPWSVRGPSPAESSAWRGSTSEESGESNGERRRHDQGRRQHPRSTTTPVSVQVGSISCPLTSGAAESRRATRTATADPRTETKGGDLASRVPTAAMRQDSDGARHGASTPSDRSTPTTASDRGS